MGKCSNVAWYHALNSVFMITHSRDQGVDVLGELIHKAALMGNIKFFSRYLMIICMH